MHNFFYSMKGRKCAALLKEFMMWMLLVGWLSLTAEEGKATTIDRKTLFDSAWKFSLGDESSAHLPSYDDSQWRTVVLPHDWSIEQSVDKNAASGNDGGYYPTGIGWYRKTFTAPSELKGEKVYLYFEGVYMNSSVYLNGRLIGGHPYGYSSFFCDATSALLPGEKNVVAVRVDNSQQINCRWYSGSGIYRHVWLLHTPQLHIDHWGVAVQTKELTSSQAVLQVKTMLRNETAQTKSVEVVTRIEGADDGRSTVTLPANSRQEVVQEVVVNSPKVWDLDNPSLYEAHISIVEEGKIVDTYRQPFGIRTISYSTKGFFLNGKKIDMNGACVHHDHGILGAASFDAAERHKAKLLKEAGFNAVRTSHNLPAEAFLEACDRIGLVVIDEAFDGWRDEKNKHDYSTLFDTWWTEDVDAMVLRDRNHPSIISWSIGNEVIERKKLEVVTTAKKLADRIRLYDDRPVTSALASWDRDWEIYDPLAAQLDIVGYNYLIQKQEEDHRRVPSRVMWQTESYPKDAFRNWSLVYDKDYIVGDFVWTGIDYLGESGIGRWWYDGDVAGEHWERLLYPWHAAYCGDIDLIGWRKPISHYRNILYNDTEKLYMAVREPDGYYGKINVGMWAVWPTWESWNWPGYEGKPIDVEIYSKYPTVRLYLDEQLVGEKAVGRDTEMKATFTLPFKEGTLRAEGIADGVVKETKSLSTAAAPAAIRLVAEERTLQADGQDLAYVQVEVVDKKGRICPHAEVPLEAIVTGQGALIAMGNANIKDTDGYADDRHTTWKGRALIIVRSQEKRGKVKLMVKSKGLGTASHTFVVK